MCEHGAGRGVSKVLVSRDKDHRGIMLTTRYHTTIADIPRETWDDFFPGDAEGWPFYLACEEAPTAGFQVGYISVSNPDGVLVAAAPVFHTRHELYSSVSGPVRRLFDGIARHFPRFLALGVSGLGSPQVDRCHIGVSTALSSDDRIKAIHGLVTALDESARTHGNKLLAVKDLEDTLPQDIGAALEGSGFAKIRSLPNTYLDLPFASWDDFLNKQSRSDRRYYTRKERTLDRILVEYRDDVEAVSEQMHALYDQTRNQSKGDYGAFETLHPQFFAAVKKHCGDRAQFMLCWLDGKLVGFQLLILGDTELIGKVIGMDYAYARELNLYFVNINQAIRLALIRRIPRIRMGNTAYAVKAVYKARLVTHWIFFRHRNAAVNALLRRLAPLVDYEKNDPDLAKMRAAEAEKAKSA